MLDLDVIFDPDRDAIETAGTDIDPDDLGEWKETYLERLAIMIEDGGVPLEYAEAMALTDTVQHLRRIGVTIPQPRRL